MEKFSCWGDQLTRAGLRIDVVVRSPLEEEARRNTLRDDDDGQLRLPIRIQPLTRAKVSLGFVAMNVGELAWSEKQRIYDAQVFTPFL